jgi:hypothetical protein
MFCRDSHVQEELLMYEAQHAQESRVVVRITRHLYHDEP